MSLSVTLIVLYEKRAWGNHRVLGGWVGSGGCSRLELVREVSGEP